MIRSAYEGDWKRRPPLDQPVVTYSFERKLVNDMLIGPCHLREDHYASSKWWLCGLKDKLLLYSYYLFLFFVYNLIAWLLSVELVSWILVGIWNKDRTLKGQMYSPLRYMTPLWEACCLEVKSDVLLKKLSPKEVYHSYELRCTYKEISAPRLFYIFMLMFYLSVWWCYYRSNHFG